ncbi:CDK-activating kinase 1AT [Wolffia australiana]
MEEAAPPRRHRSWSIHGRPEINHRYEIMERVGSGAYSDVYRARRISDGQIVALKEIHDHQSALREIEALQILNHSPNVVHLLEYFWQEDEDAVLVLEFLVADLASVIRHGNRSGGIAAAEVKQWMIQTLRAVDECHRNGVIHRDLKPSNLLVSADGVLKLADFGQARVIDESRFMAAPEEQVGSFWKDRESQEEAGDVDASCVATCCTSDVEDDQLNSYFSMQEGGEAEGEDGGGLSSCVGTRWYRAPELLFGATSYGAEIDLWALGCVLGELGSLQPVFPGSSDIDQLGRIFSVLGNLTEESSPGCSRLPDYGKIFFSAVDQPVGLEAWLGDRARPALGLVSQLLRLDHAARVPASELLQDKYFAEPPLPCALPDLTLPARSADSGSDPGSDDVLDDGFSVRFD